MASISTLPQIIKLAANKTDQTSRLLRWIPSALWLIAAVLLLISIPFPYWGMELQAPQYPQGLHMRVYVDHMTDDNVADTIDEVHEIDGLNHYIGMKSLYDAAKVERSLAIPGFIAAAILLVIAALLQRRWAWLLSLPAVTIPFVFLGVMALWLTYYGQNLDPYAPLSSAIQPFSPPVLGEGIIGQFKTVASVFTGWYLALGAAVLVVIGVAVRFWQAHKIG
jgi:hypothetical protein